MSWFRANIKHGSRLALFALLLQFALAFGHVHWLAGQIADSGRVTTAQAHSGSAPASRDPDQQPSAEGCAICAVMAMAQSILLSPAPVLTLPESVAFRLPDTITVALAAVVIDAAFQPRAPPLA
ncbi:conserved protein of unknown function [Bradyrhizobium sp. ORS 285]|uniref:DUF2946 family protein n=1 Tax=Bradyrhizobium sp. ORS 285 TaxID=115808 RepID=UPI0002405C2D|nr:DUF2946 family protein [Bradyrhizobium sp. ORS 285]CCD87115.1 conserved hypothetical protein [Bradyrhizobium sp. ORS 285]SMX60143.1 conserved protein of unknown function [Bradyrhizobium sp. ORS 285]